MGITMVTRVTVGPLSDFLVNIVFLHLLSLSIHLHAVQALLESCESKSNGTRRFSSSKSDSVCWKYSKCSVLDVGDEYYLSMDGRDSARKRARRRFVSIS